MHTPPIEHYGLLYDGWYRLTVQSLASPRTDEKSVQVVQYMMEVEPTHAADLADVVEAKCADNLFHFCWENGLWPNWPVSFTWHRYDARALTWRTVGKP